MSRPVSWNSQRTSVHIDESKKHLQIIYVTHVSLQTKTLFVEHTQNVCRDCVTWPLGGAQVCLAATVRLGWQWQRSILLSWVWKANCEVSVRAVTRTEVEVMLWYWSLARTGILARFAGFCTDKMCTTPLTSPLFTKCLHWLTCCSQHAGGKNVHQHLASRPLPSGFLHTLYRFAQALKDPWRRFWQRPQTCRDIWVKFVVSFIFLPARIPIKTMFKPFSLVH